MPQDDIEQYDWQDIEKRMRSKGGIVSREEIMAYTKHRYPKYYEESLILQSAIEKIVEQSYTSGWNEAIAAVKDYRPSDNEMISK